MRKAGVLSVGSTAGLCQAPDNIDFSVGLIGALPEGRCLERSVSGAVQRTFAPASGPAWGFDVEL